MAYKLDIRGRMYGVNAVCGYLTADDAPPRAVNIILLERASREGTKAALEAIKAQSSAYIFPAVGHDVSAFQKQFESTSVTSFHAEIFQPSYIAQTVSIVLKETDAPLIQFVCANKETFWSLLRYFGTARKDLLQLAEIDGLAHEERTEQTERSIGTAHKFCDSLNKTIRKFVHSNAVAPHIPLFTDIYGRPLGGLSNEDWIKKHTDIVAKIIESTKIKLADHNHPLCFFSALNRLVLTDMEACEMAIQMKRAPGGQRGKRKFYKKDDGVFNSEAIEEMSHLPEEELRQRQKAARDIWRDMAGTKLDDQNFGDSPFYITRFDPDDYNNNLLAYMVRRGFPLMPSKTCLFEIKRVDFESPEKGISLHGCPTIEENMLILAEDEGNNVRFTLMNYNDDFPAFGPIPGLSQGGYILKRANGAFDKIEAFFIERPHEHIEMFEAAKMNDDVWKYYPLIVHCVNALTRFGDPEYKPTYKEPRPQKRTGFFKGRQEMFTYIQMDQPLDLDINMSHRSEREGLRASPIVHWRRSHLRRFHENGMLVGVSLIPPAIVGKEANGVVKRGYHFTTK